LQITIYTDNLSYISLQIYEMCTGNSSYTVHFLDNYNFDTANSLDTHSFHPPAYMPTAFTKVSLFTFLISLLESTVMIQHIYKVATHLSNSHC